MIMKRSGKRGFTLVEMMISVTVIGLIAAIATPKYIKSKEMADENLCSANRHKIEEQIDFYLSDHPSLTIDDVTMQTLLDENYLKHEPRCSAGGTYTLGFPVTCDQHPDS